MRLKVRFANHSHKAPNCEPRVVIVRGERRVGLFVKSKPLEVRTVSAAVLTAVCNHPLFAGWNGAVI